MSGSASVALSLTCLLGVLLSGCYQLTRTVDRSLASKASGLEEHAPHYSDVLRELGPPSKLTAMEGGFAFLYEHAVTRQWQLGHSVEYTIDRVASDIEVPLLRMSVARGKVEVDDGIGGARSE